MKKALQALIGTAVFSSMILAGSMAFAYTWTVQFPSDLDSNITSCTVLLYDKTANYGTRILTRGSSTSWSSAVVSGQPSPLFYVSGHCQYMMWGTTQDMARKGRTCNGTDFSNSVDASVACSSNVSLKICRKAYSTGTYGNYVFGFCPN